MNGRPTDDDERLRGALARLDEEHQDLRSIISVAAHDVRSPLTGLHGFVQLLQTDRLDPAMTATVLDRLSMNAADAVRMLDGLFEVLKSGVSDEPPAAVLLGPVLADASAELATDHPDVVVDQSAQGTVWAPPAALRTLLDHLLRNAGRHAGPDARVAVTAAPDGTDLIVTISDSGPGIPPEEAERIFQIYHRGQAPSGSAGQDPSGSGVGLTVCRRLARAAAGDVWLSSTPSPLGGAAFKLRLPTRGPFAAADVAGPGGTTDHI